MPEWAYQIMVAIATGGGVYAGIRADIAALHVKADAARNAATDAHRRIDSLLAKRG